MKGAHPKSAAQIPLAPRAGMVEDTMYGEDSKPL
jgi:hypothetical protein